MQKTIKGETGDMANRVIKDSIWHSPTLAKLSEKAQDHFPRWLLMADDWGCFLADSRVIKGLVYPLRDSMQPEDVEAIKQELNEAGILFLWEEDEREWGYFVSWESHHNFCNKTNVDNGGKNQKHRRKTPEPPNEQVSAYIDSFKNKEKKTNDSKDLDTLGQNSTRKNKILNPNPNPNPNPNKRVKSNENKKSFDLANWFEEFWKGSWYGSKGSKKKALESLKKLDPDESVLEEMESARVKQYQQRHEQFKQEGWAENMQHMERWFRNERWLDEIGSTEPPEKITFVSKQAYEKFLNDPDNKKKIEIGRLVVKYKPDYTPSLGSN